jgi:hypothetical protein
MYRVLVFVVAAMAVGCTSVSDDRQAIEQMLHQRLDRSGVPLEINPIIVRERYAIADWTQGTNGGRVLLRQEHGGWKVMAEAGEELRDAQFLKQAGMTQQEASALANVLIAAERRLPESRLALFDSYAEKNVRR